MIYTATYVVFTMRCHLEQVRDGAQRLKKQVTTIFFSYHSIKQLLLKSLVKICRIATTLSWL